MTGGGSGGHITPILAVARELKQLQPKVELIYIGQRGDQLLDVPAASPYIDEVYAVWAGKFRRYHGEGFKQAFDLPTLGKNIRDAWRVLVGIRQSYRLLGKLKPDCIFVKGGFVGVPVGLAAAKRHIPFVTHDSDALPGLANRTIARWAALHAVGLPKEIYRYPQAKTVTVGVPVQAEFRAVTEAGRRAYRHQIGLEKQGRLLFVTGGGNGALLLNDAVAAFVPELLKIYSDLTVMHVAGRLHKATLAEKYDKLLPDGRRKRVRVLGFVTDLYAFSGAADVVITRAGATTLAELALQQKACVVVPNPLLTGGHQVKNAKYLEDQQAVKCVMESQLKQHPRALSTTVQTLLDSPEERRAMGRRFGSFARPDAARRLAVLLLEQVRVRR